MKHIKIFLGIICLSLSLYTVIVSREKQQIEKERKDIVNFLDKYKSSKGGKRARMMAKVPKKRNRLKELAQEELTLIEEKTAIEEGLKGELQEKILTLKQAKLTYESKTGVPIKLDKKIQEIVKTDVEEKDDDYLKKAKRKLEPAIQKIHSKIIDLEVIPLKKRLGELRSTLKKKTEKKDTINKTLEKDKTNRYLLNSKKSSKENEIEYAYEDKDRKKYEKELKKIMKDVSKLEKIIEEKENRINKLKEEINTLEKNIEDTEDQLKKLEH